MHVKVISQKNSGREKQISIRCENPFLQDVCLRKRVLIVSSHRQCRILPAHKFLQQYCWYGWNSPYNWNRRSRHLCSGSRQMPNGKRQALLSCKPEEYGIVFCENPQNELQLYYTAYFFVCKCTNCTKKYCNNCGMCCIRSGAAQFFGNFAGAQTP